MNDERFQVNFSLMPSVIFFIDAFEQRYTLTHLLTWLRPASITIQNEGRSLKRSVAARKRSTVRIIL
jgi:hypothetical protein